VNRIGERKARSYRGCLCPLPSRRRGSMPLTRESRTRGRRQPTIHRSVIAASVRRPYRCERQTEDLCLPQIQRPHNLRIPINQATDSAVELELAFALSRRPAGWRAYIDDRRVSSDMEQTRSKWPQAACPTLEQLLPALGLRPGNAGESLRPDRRARTGTYPLVEDRPEGVLVVEDKCPSQTAPNGFRRGAGGSRSHFASHLSASALEHRAGIFEAWGLMPSHGLPFKCWKVGLASSNGR